MEELLRQIKKLADSMLRDASAQDKKGNKAAGLRARKASLALEPMLKEFRKISIAKMKGLAALVLVAGLAGTACMSCEQVDPTDLTEASQPVKSIICGHVRYCPAGSDKYTAEPGLEVNIFYGRPDEKGNVEYALKTVKTGQDGYFETRLGCPAGQSLKVKVECRGKADNKAADEGGKTVTTDAYFYAEQEKTVSCGTAAYFKIDMTPVANVGDAGLANK